MRAWERCPICGESYPETPICSCDQNQVTPEKYDGENRQQRRYRERMERKDRRWISGK